MTQNESGGKRFWRLVYPYLTYILVVFAVSCVAAFIMSGQILAAHESSQVSMEILMEEMMNLYTQYQVLIQGAASAVTIPFMILYYQKNRRRRLMAGIPELLAERGPQWMVLIFLFGAVSCYAANGMLAISGVFESSTSYDDVAAVFYQGKIVIEILALGILTPIVEEFIFRGLFYTQLTEFVPQKMAILVASLMFGMYHGNLLQALYAFAIGLLLIYVYERFHTILAPIIFHIGANIIGVVLSETTALDFLYSTKTALMISVTFASFSIIGIVRIIESWDTAKKNAVRDENNEKLV